MNAAIRLLAWTLALALVALPVVAVLNGWLAADRWPIQRLRLTAEYERVSAEQVRAAVAPQLGKGFFALDLAQVRESVAALPWVESVEVRKRWPDLIEISLREHRPVAHWGQDRLLSDRGRLFSASGLEALQGLPRLEGPDARLADVVSLHARAQRLFTGTGLSVPAVRLSARGSWSLGLSNGTRVVIGRSDADERLGRLVRVLPQLLAGETRAVERIDLRYTNGFAVRWAAAPATGSGNARPGAAPSGAAPDAPPASRSTPSPSAATNPPSRIPNPGSIA